MVSELACVTRTYSENRLTVTHTLVKCIKLVIILTTETTTAKRIAYFKRYREMWTERICFMNGENRIGLMDHRIGVRDVCLV